MTEETEATLNNWWIISNPPHGFVIRGFIEGDTKGRFRDGALVTTSQVHEFNFNKRWFQTMNTTYALGPQLCGEAGRPGTLENTNAPKVDTEQLC